MKWQISDQQWRLRVTEDELQRLREGHTLTSTTALPGNAVFRLRLALAAVAQAHIEHDADHDGDDWKISLPTASVEAYVQRLPCRDGVDFVLPVGTDTTLELAFEVDVRDSIRHRGVRPRPG